MQRTLSDVIQPLRASKWLLKGDRLEGETYPHPGGEGEARGDRKSPPCFLPTGRFRTKFLSAAAMQKVVGRSVLGDKGLQKQLWEQMAVRC